MWVGLFVIVSLGVLGVLMVWFGEAPEWLGSSDWTLQITGVRELSGIGDGSPVTLNGVEIGRVQGIDFADRGRPDEGVIIIARINRLYSVPRRAYAKVYGATLGLGSGHVTIVVEPGAPPVPLPKTGASIPGEMHSIFGEIVTKDMLDSIERTITNVGDLTKEWTPVGTNLAQLLEPRTVEQLGRPGAVERGLTPNISTVIERIDNLARHINAVLGDENMQEDVKGAIADLRDATNDLKSTVKMWQSESKRIADNVNGGVDDTRVNLDKAFDKLLDVLGGLNESAADLARITEAVSEGHGTAGMLVRDDRLYESAVLALERFSDAMATLQRILGKIEEDGYITVGQAPSGLLKKKFAIPERAVSQN